MRLTRLASASGGSVENNLSRQPEIARPKKHVTDG